MDENQNGIEITNNISNATENVDNINNIDKINDNENNDNETNTQTKFEINNFYVSLKQKIMNLVNLYIFPFVDLFKNNSFGKIIVLVISMLVIIFGYVTTSFLQFLYFFNCTINSIKIMKQENTNETDVKNVVNNWITYSGIVLIFSLCDIASFVTGNIFYKLFDLIKLCSLIYLFNSEKKTSDLNYAITRLYHCNNRVLDTLSNGTYNLLDYVHSSYDKKHFQDIINNARKTKTN